MPPALPRDDTPPDGNAHERHVPLQDKYKFLLVCFASVASAPAHDQGGSKGPPRHNDLII